MLNPFQLLDAWMMIGGTALMLLIFLAVFLWNSPRRREPAASSRKSELLRMASPPSSVR
jgi:hypothetical protein